MSPAGTEIAGFQHRFASIVNGVAEAPTGPVCSPSITSGGGPSAGKAGTAVVGVITTSTVAEQAGRVERQLLAPDRRLRAHLRHRYCSVCSSTERL